MPRPLKTSGEAMRSQLIFTNADEPALDAIFSGRSVPTGYPWFGGQTPIRLSPGSFGVLCKQRRDSTFLQPIALVAREEEYRRLFGRLAQIKNDFSPLTSWCHLLTPKQFEPFDETAREADLGGLEACWTGLAVAEALLLSEMPVSKLNISACLATQSFVVARTKALWDTALKDVLERYDSAHQMFRANASRLTKLRAAFEPIWTILAAVSNQERSDHTRQFAPLIEAVRALHDARVAESSDETFDFVRPLASIVPESDVLRQLPRLTPELRVREFDKLIAALNTNSKSESLLSRHALAMLAGYLSTVAAGGAPSLALAEPHAARWPEITAWAYVVGSAGQRVVWTSSFDGLGRLIVRELMRSFRLDEGPSCDFSLDEAIVLFDGQLSDPFVHLRIKQSRIATVSLNPGVNMPVSLAEQSAESRTGESTTRERYGGNIGRLINPESLDALSDAVWRRLRGRLESYVETIALSTFRNLERSRGRRASQQSKLPLKSPDEK
jgi:hypothetical protein